MTDSNIDLKEFLENSPLYFVIHLEKMGNYKAREIELDCANCKNIKPFHIDDPRGVLFNSPGMVGQKELYRATYKCVSCRGDLRIFWLHVETIENEKFQVHKVGQHPRGELPRSKTLSKFFKGDREEYNKAVTCMANGYGVAAFAYMRRIVESNINDLLDMIGEDDMINDDIKDALVKLKAASPMSSKIAIANKALPDYLLIDGHNLLGTMYKVLSDGVHTLTDQECLKRAKAVQNCLEFLISGLAAHKNIKKSVKDDLEYLKKV